MYTKNSEITASADCLPEMSDRTSHRMKASFYNFAYPYDSEKKQYILFNGITCAMALISDEDYQKLKNLEKKGIQISDETLVSELRRGKFIINSGLNELDYIRFRMLTTRYNKEKMILTIAPTLDCNFACIYCYEGNKAPVKQMSYDTQDKIIELIKAQAKTLRSLIVTWYGGEPLLCEDIIDQLSMRILEVCQDNNIAYTATIVTNGYLLSKQTVQNFKKWHVEACQVTLDGMADVHDERRPLKNGGPTFEVIMRNLCAIKDIIPFKIGLRINIDKTNSNQIDEIIKIINDYGIQNIVHPYLAMVENINDTFTNVTCLNNKDFAALDLLFIEKHDEEDHHLLYAKYPQCISTACGAETNNYYVVGPEGELYKCWNDIGYEDRVIGNILKPIEIKQTLLDYITYDPTSDIECRVCKYMPLCMGGCPHRRMFRNNTRCTNIKYGMHSYLKRLAHIYAHRNNEKT